MAFDSQTYRDFGGNEASKELQLPILSTILLFSSNDFVCFFSLSLRSYSPLLRCAPRRLFVCLEKLTLQNGEDNAARAAYILTALLTFAIAKIVQHSVATACIHFFRVYDFHTQHKK